MAFSHQDNPAGAKPAGGQAGTPVQGKASQLSSRAREVLRVLGWHGPLRTGDVVDQVSGSRPTVMGALDELREQGLVVWEGKSRNDPHAVWTEVSPPRAEGAREVSRAPDLLDRIDAALAYRTLDPHLFERCAGALLTEVHPTLTPVTGGKDFGRDADVPGAGAEPPMRLVVTTAKDVRRNLRDSLSQLRRKGEDVREVMLATSQPLSADARRKLEKTAGKAGARLVAVYDRRWLANMLYRDADWRKRLIGVTGEPCALVSRPLDLAERTWGMLDLVGRDQELRELAESRGDIVLVGPPGSGKTRLLAEVERAMFVERYDPERLADDIRTFAPLLVVVDDAHLRASDRVRLLRRIRHDEDSQFRIVVVGWPERQEELRALLPDAQVVTLGDLEREQIAELLRQMGITGLLLTAELIDQAKGRPGWAVSLAELVDKGEAASVLQGHALIRHVERYLRQTGSDDDQLDLLARIAALDGLYESDLPQMAAHLGTAEHQVTGWLQRSTTNGIVELRDGCWRVRPERLRQALVAQWFFGEPPRATYTGLLDQWPGRHIVLLESASLAALLGTEAAGHFADQHAPAVIRDLSDPLESVWRELLDSYARTSEHAARMVTSVISKAVQGEDPPAILRPASTWEQALPQVTRIMRWETAVRILGTVAENYLLPEALDALVWMAQRDDRAPHARSSDPLRALEELASRHRPDAGTSFEGRRAVLQAATRLVQRANSEQETDLAGELARAALTPRGEGAWMDPASFNRIVVTRSIDPPSRMCAIAEQLWPEWASALPRLSDRAVKEVLDGLQEWDLIAAEVADEAAETARACMRSMLLAVRERAARSPGLAVHWNCLASRGGLPDRIDVDPEFAELVIDPWEYGERWPDEATAHVERIRLLARKWARPTPGAVLPKLHGWHQQSKLLSRSGSFWLLFQQLGQQVEDPTEWAVQALKLGFSDEPAVLSQLFTASLRRDPDGVMRWLTPALNDPTCRGTAISAALGQEARQKAVDLVLAALTENDAHLIERIVCGRSDPDHVVRSLLTHPLAIIRGQTAMCFSVGNTRHGPGLPADWWPLWSQAFLEASAADGAVTRTYWLGEILRELARLDPDLAAAWFARHLASTRTGERLSSDLIERVAALPRDHRLRLLRQYGQGPDRRRLVKTTLADDPSWAAELIDSDIIEPNEALGTIKNEHRSPYFETLGPILLDRGATALEIVDMLEFGACDGPDSERYAEFIDYCEHLATSDDPRLTEIGRAGCELFLRRRQHALEEEHRARVRGR
ncbi:MAG: hypothetical protein ACRDZ4_05110 [Egibacteraceae bacterium]